MRGIGDFAMSIAMMWRLDRFGAYTSGQGSITASQDKEGQSTHCLVCAEETRKFTNATGNNPRGTGASGSTFGLRFSKGGVET